MNAILGVYTDLDEFTNLQCDYVETWEKCEHLEKELSKSRTMSKSFEALQKHAINLELDLQQCKEKIKNDKSFKENQSNVFLKEREQYFEIQDLKAQLQDTGIAISSLCYIVKDGENLDKIKEKGDACIFVGYATQSKAYKYTVQEPRGDNRLINVDSQTWQLLSTPPSAQLWTKDIHYKQVIDNPSQSVEQDSLETDGRCYEENIVISNKSRLVAKGYAQKEGINFEESFATHLLGLKLISRSTIPRVSFINQAKYAQEILKKHGMTSCDSIGTPMATKPLDADLSGTFRLPNENNKELSEHSVPKTSGDKFSQPGHKVNNQTARVIQKAGLHLNVFSRSRVEKGIVELFFVRTEYQLADLFTKALSEDRFKYLVRRLGMRCLTPDELEVLAIKSA
ncbi:hypothetical protein Tco_0280898 [Tanacetum coccineum]